MLNSTLKFDIRTLKPKVKELIQNCSFYYILDEDEEIISNSIIQSLKDSAALIIKYIENQQKQKFFVIGFKDVIFIINQPLLSVFQKLFSINSNIPIYLLNDTKDNFNNYLKSQIEIKNAQYEINEQFDDEIYHFNHDILNFSNELFSHQVSIEILSCITGYLIQESYSKTSKHKDLYDQIILLINDSLTPKVTINDCTDDDYIELRDLGLGSSSIVKLIYHIERKELFALKKPNGNFTEEPKLFQREIRNYIECNTHPLIPKFYGITKDNYLIIQYIEGQKLSDLEKDQSGKQLLKLTFEEKILIIAQLLCIFENLYHQDYVYRDLKPDNVIINHNKVVSIIDFDRMIKISDFSVNDQKHTKDFNSDFIDPEVFYNHISDRNDIYSLGKMIYYIINEEKPSGKSFKSELFEQNPELYEIYQKCVGSISERPMIRNILAEFLKLYFTPMYNYFMANAKVSQNLFSILSNETVLKGIKNLAKSKIDGKFIKIDPKETIHFYSVASDMQDQEAQYQLGTLYYEGKSVDRDINKSIYYFDLAAKQNNLEALCYLGNIYYDGKYIKQNKKKSIEYYSSAAEKNYLKAQFNLGIIFSEDETFKDIKKAVYYLTLAAEQNDSEAQYKLGIIYLEDDTMKDIDKSIYYLKMSADQNELEAQFKLGIIYYDGDIVQRDINKSIHYLKLAANQNHLLSQHNLGIIYSDGKYVPIDINESIHYLSLASEQNYSKSQNNLGNIYLKGKYIERNVEKAMHYFSLAANQEDPNAHFALGLIYYQGKYVNKDINKAIFHFQTAAKLNNSDAQNILGIFYYEGEYISQDINKSIHNFELAEKQNNSCAQYNLGKYYLSQNNRKGIDLLIKSSKNYFHEANFALGFIYHQGKYINQDINQSIHFYKEASSFNNHKAKNNLGIIYKNGFGDKIRININYAITLFKEAIEQKNDAVSMYNLSHIFIYNEQIKDKINESIDSLIKSYNTGFPPSKNLLCIALLQKYNFDLIEIQKILSEKDFNDLYSKICQIIKQERIDDKSNFEQFYEKNKSIDFIYDCFENIIFTTDLNDKSLSETKKNNNSENLSFEFYTGFGDF